MKGRRSNGEGCPQQINGRWYVKYTDPGTRKQTTKGTGAPTREESRKRFELLKAAWTRGEYVTVDSITVAEFADTWLEEVRLRREPNTAQLYESVTKGWINPILGGFRMQDVRPLHCQHFIATLIQKGKTPKSIQTYSAVLCNMFSVAVKRELIARNPASRLDMPKAEKKPVIFMTPDIKEAFLEAIITNPYRPVFEFGLSTGMRLSEILGLQWGNVDMKNKVVTVATQLERKHDGSEYSIKSVTKGHKVRTVPVADFVIETILKPVRRRQAEQKLKLGRLWHNDNNLVFTREDGTPLRQGTVEDAMKRIAGDIGHPELTFHKLRSTFITELSYRGANVRVLADMVGHSSERITNETYTGVTEEAKRELAQKIQVEYDMRCAK